MGHFLNKILTLLDATWLTSIALIIYNCFAIVGEFAVRHEVGIRLSQSTLLFVVGVTYGYYRARYYKRLWDNNHVHEDDKIESLKKPKKWWDFLK